MNRKLQNLFNFVNDNFGKDNTIIGLSGFKNKAEYVYIDIPKEIRKTFIQNIEKNYLLL